MDNKGKVFFHPEDKEFLSKIIYVLFAGVILFVLCGILLVIGPKYTAVITSCALIFLLFLFVKELPVYLIILALFFEAYVFSFYFFGARIRAIQVIEVVTIYVMILLVAAGKLKLKKTPLDLWLWMYIGINFVSLMNAPAMDRSLKISMLLLGLALLYYVFVYLIVKKKVFLRVFHLVLYVGLAQVLYGLYQVLAGMGRIYLNINLPIGHADIMHQAFLKSPWGRPYGTFVEPDWYGAICMFYAVMFVVLYSFDSFNRKKYFLAGLILSLTGLFFSFVRSAWVGFFVALILLVCVKKKAGLGKFRVNIVYKIAFFSTIMILIVVLLVPSITCILKVRFMLESPHEAPIPDSRLVTNKYAFKSFLKNPILGNGPGSPILMEGTPEHQEVVASGLIYVIDVEFPHSIVMTLLQNTGIVGFLCFLFLFVRYIKFNMRNIPKLDSPFQALSLALFGGVLALFVSYLFTNGLWIPFTWVFIGLSIVATNISLNDTQSNNRDALREQ